MTGPRRIELVPIDRSAAPVLARLMQLYAYDFSEITGAQIGSDGLYAAPEVDAFFGARDRHPFLIVADDAVAGFVVVDQRSRFGNDDAPLDVAEFFVLRKFRRAGVGRAAAEAIFTRFEGRWEIRQIAKNTPATEFWRRVVDRYTGGAFDETVYDDSRWRGPVQRFDNRASPRR